MAVRAEGMRGGVELRYMKNIDSYKLLNPDFTPIRFDVGCIVVNHPYEYELLQDDDILDNRGFLEMDAHIRAKYDLPPRAGSILTVTPTQKPALEITSERVVGGVEPGDTVGLLIELRHLRRLDYTVSPLRVHIY